jgi:hypothetical protein
MRVLLIQLPLEILQFRAKFMSRQMGIFPARWRNVPHLKMAMVVQAKHENNFKEEIVYRLITSI